VRDSRSFELSQGKSPVALFRSHIDDVFRFSSKKGDFSLNTYSFSQISPINSISYSTARSKDWDDILTAHTDETFARSWTTLNKRLGKHTLGFADSVKGKSKERNVLGSIKVNHAKKTVASSLMFLEDVCVTACGNFGLAGSSTGLIHMWNMQSGIKRKSYDVGPCPPEASARLRNGAQKRDRVITGLATDPLNRIVIASTFDGTLNVGLLRLA
jgi:U3 small nucleolar RNA-associated protein 21